MAESKTPQPLSDCNTIQEMVKQPLHEIPTRYLIDQEPTIKSICSADQENFNFPIIDFQKLVCGDGRNFELEKFHSISKDWGIFQLVNHGVDHGLVEKLKYEIEGFYKLPLEERLKYRIRPGEVEGYGQTIIFNEDQKLDWADRFYMMTNPIHRRKPHLLPQLPSSFRETLEEYMRELQKLSRALFELIRETLNIDKREMEEMFEDGMQALRMTYYPPCPRPDKVMGLTPHSDASGITILLQVNGVSGFQVKKDGVWLPVDILPDALIINLGDVMEILSNGLYKSIEHRAVVNPEKERMSMAMFFNPKFEAEVGPSPSLLCRINQPPRFRRMIMEQYVKDFFSRRLNGKTFLHYMKI